MKTIKIILLALLLTGCSIIAKDMYTLDIIEPSIVENYSYYVMDINNSAIDRYQKNYLLYEGAILHHTAIICSPNNVEWYIYDIIY